MTPHQAGTCQHLSFLSFSITMSVQLNSQSNSFASDLCVCSDPEHTVARAHSCIGSNTTGQINASSLLETTLVQFHSPSAHSSAAFVMRKKLCNGLQQSGAFQKPSLMGCWARIRQKEHAIAGQAAGSGGFILRRMSSQKSTV